MERWLSLALCVAPRSRNLESFSLIAQGVWIGVGLDEPQGPRALGLQISLSHRQQRWIQGWGPLLRVQRRQVWLLCEARKCHTAKKTQTLRSVALGRGGRLPRVGSLRFRWRLLKILEVSNSMPHAKQNTILNQPRVCVFFMAPFVDSFESVSQHSPRVFRGGGIGRHGVNDL